MYNGPRPVSNFSQTFHFSALARKEGLVRHGLNVGTLPGKPPEVLTAEIDCFSRSVLSSGPPPPQPPPFTCADKDLCKLQPTQPAPSQKIIFFINRQNILSLTPLTNILFMKRQLIWVFESRKSVHYWWSCISFASEWKELTCMPHMLSGVCTEPCKSGWCRPRLPFRTLPL